jgi:hypothetical protein
MRGKSYINLDNLNKKVLYFMSSNDGSDAM